MGIFLDPDVNTKYGIKIKIWILICGLHKIIDIPIFEVGIVLS